MGSSAYIGIGSNLGDRRANVLEAMKHIGGIDGTRVVRASSLYESEPHGNAKTWFVNAVVEVDTELMADAFLKATQAIEKTMGRKRVKGKRWGSRVIDLDLLLWNQDVIKKRTLKIPHPQMHKRRFVLLPLAELGPHVVHPTIGESVSVLLASTDDAKRVTLLPRA